MVGLLKEKTVTAMEVVDESRVIADRDFADARYGSSVTTERRSSRLRDGQTDCKSDDSSVKYWEINRFISG